MTDVMIVAEEPARKRQDRIDMAWAIRHFGPGFIHSVLAVAQVKASEAEYRARHPSRG